MTKKDMTCRIEGCSSAASHNYINHTLLHPSEIEIELYKLVRNTERCPKKRRPSSKLTLREDAFFTTENGVFRPTVRPEPPPPPREDSRRSEDDSLADLSFRRSSDGTPNVCDLPEEGRLSFGPLEFESDFFNDFFLDEGSLPPGPPLPPIKVAEAELEKAPVPPEPVGFDLLVNGNQLVEPRFCHHHSLPGMINVYAKLCAREGCPNKSAHVKGKGAFCYRHREFGSVADVSVEVLQERICGMSRTIDKLQRELSVSESLRKKSDDTIARYEECWLRQTQIVTNLQAQYQKLYEAFQLEIRNHNRLKSVYAYANANTSVRVRDERPGTLNPPGCLPAV
jgi:hypothetical protein